MHIRNGARIFAATCAFICGFSLVRGAQAQTVTWGVGGAGGSGNWDTTTKNWFNGVTNVAWPDQGNAIFAGAAGGTVKSFFFGPNVSSMTFNTPGYVIQDGWIETGTSGLTVTTNASAKITSTLSDSGNPVSLLIKSGSAALTLNSTVFLDMVRINQGELIDISGGLTFSDVQLANVPGAKLTVGGVSIYTSVHSLSGGGSLGGVVQPNDQSRELTLFVSAPGTFDGVIQDNGAGRLGLNFGFSSGAQTLTNANTYSGKTTILPGTVVLSGNGSAVNSPFVVDTASALVLDNSNHALGDRISNSADLTLNGSELRLIGNGATPLEEFAGKLKINDVATVTVNQTDSVAAKMTFAGLQRNGHALLNIAGSGVQITGMANGATGIVSPYITVGSEWGTIGADGRIEALTTYSTSVNAGAASDHVKLSGGGVTALAVTTTRASLNFQNNDALASRLFDLSGRTLQITSGGVLSSGVSGVEINDGNLVTSAAEWVISTNNKVSIGASLGQNGGIASLTKGGPGELTLSGVNTYTGPTSIVQGTLIVGSDAALGMGSSVDVSGGVLRAAGSFTSPKSITFGGYQTGAIDTAGFDVTFAGANTGIFAKTGLGTLTLSNPATGQVTLNAGVLALPHATSGDVYLSGGTLRAAGTLGLIQQFKPSTVDIAGPAAGMLTSRTFFDNANANLLVNFGVGMTASDRWEITGSVALPTTPGAIQFEFQSLGGAKLGVDYLLMTFDSFASGANSSIFAFAPDMAAKGWSGFFSASGFGVSVRFTSVPEPGVSAFLFLQGALCGWIALRRNRRGAPRRRIS